MARNNKLEKRKGPPILKSLSFYGKLRLIIQYLIEDLKRGPLQFKIAVFTIFIIVAFMSILLNSNGITVTMFLTLAEAQVGDVDFIITQRFTTTGTQLSSTSSFDTLVKNFPLLNISDIQKRVRNVPDLRGASERWLLPGMVLNPENASLSTNCIAVLGNSLKERSIGIGRALRGAEILEGNQAYIFRRTANVIKLPGDKVTFRLDFLKFLAQNNFQVNDISEIEAIVGSILPSSINITAESLTDSLQSLANNTLTVDNTTIPPNDFVTVEDINTFIGGVINGTISLIENANITLLQFNTTNVNKILVQTIQDILRVNVELEVRDRIDNPRGKWPVNLGNVIFFETEYFFDFFRSDLERKLRSAAERIRRNVTDSIDGAELLIQQLDNQINNLLILPILNGFDSMNLKERALTMNAVVKDKADVYSSFQNYDDNLVEISNKLMASLEDTAKYNIVGPLLLGFQALGLLSVFLRSLIYAILIILAILSYILISSLMVFNIDEKTYEFGMLRALGLERQSLVYMLLIQGFVFSVAGWTIGVLAAFVVSVIVKYVFYLEARVKIGVTMEMLAWISTIFFGFATPLLTNFTSISKSLAKNLKDSLDLYRRSINELKIMFVKLAKLGISKSVFLLAVELTVYGFVFYYITPLSFYFNRFDIFLLLLNLVFLGMNLGLIVIANLVESKFEKLILWIVNLFLCKNRSLKVVIDKNLESHKKRNQKTALMITMSVCFIIFSGSGIKTNTLGLINQLVETQGADLVLTGGGVRPSSIYGLNQKEISNFLEEYKTRFPGVIADYCWSSETLEWFPFVNEVKLSPLSLYPNIDAHVTGVNTTIMSTILTELYVPNEYQTGLTYKTLPDGRLDGVSSIFEKVENSTFEQKYDPKNVLSLNQNRKQKLITVRNVRAVLPSGFVGKSGIDTQTPALLTVRALENSYARFNITHTANKVPGFGFSSYANQLFDSDILVSLESYRNLLDDIAANINKSNNIKAKETFFRYENDIVKQSEFKLPYNKLMIKLAPGVNETQKDEVKNGITTFTTDIDIIIDTPDIKKQAETSMAFLTILNSLITFLTTVIAFFMLLISLIKNIKDNIWELGILRSMGLNHGQIFTIYFVETFAVIASALILGSLVGLLVASIGAFYYVIFFELPFTLYFPWVEFILLIGSLVMTSVLTTWLGLRGIVYQPISKIMKGLL